MSANRGSLLALFPELGRLVRTAMLVEFVAMSWRFDLVIIADSWVFPANFQSRRGRRSKNGSLPSPMGNVSDRTDLRSRKIALLNLSINDELPSPRDETWAVCSSEGRGLYHERQQTEPSSTVIDPYAFSQELDPEIATLDNNSLIAGGTALTSPPPATTTLAVEETTHNEESTLGILDRNSDSCLSTSTDVPGSEISRLNCQAANRTNVLSENTTQNGRYKSGAAAYLTREGAFSFPKRQEMTLLLQAYFNWFHPCFPIVDAPKVKREYEVNGISPMLLQAMLFIGTNYVNDEFFPHRASLRDKTRNSTSTTEPRSYTTQIGRPTNWQLYRHYFLSAFGELPPAMRKMQGIGWQQLSLWRKSEATIYRRQLRQLVGTFLTLVQ